MESYGQGSSVHGGSAVAATPGRRRRIVFYCVHSLQVAAAVVEYSIVIFGVGGYDGAVALRQTHPEMFAIIRLVDLAKIAAVFGAVIWAGTKHLYLGFVMMRGRYLFSSRSSQTYYRPSSHWTAVASPGVFAESATSVRQAHNATLVLSILAILTSILPQTIKTVLDPEYAISTAQHRAHVTAVCGPEMSACRLGAIMTSFVAWVGSGIVLSMSVLALCTPIRFWSPASLRGMQATGNVRLERIVRHILVASILLGLWSAHLTGLSLAYFPYLLGDAAMYQYFFYSSCGLFACEFAAILYFMGCPSPQAVLRRRPGKVSPGHQLSPLVEAESLAPQPYTATGPLSKHQMKHRSGSWQSSLRESNLGLGISSGLRYRRDLLLAIIIYLWSFPELIVSASFIEIIVVWVKRLLVFALWVLQKDFPVQFEDLYRHGTGFGLVANARQLSEVLRRHLESGSARKDSQTGTEDIVEMYPASLFRMRETLAVSYRWQDAEAELAPGMYVNMSVWQMEQLASAIDASPVLYVWLDRFSVPQENHPEMKRTLLSRMMAVYSSAAATLVLKSIESEGSRYHQRGWTLQEYCTSSCLMLRQQQTVTQSFFSSGAELSRQCSLLPEEQGRYESTRAWYMARCESSRPFWLYRGLDTAGEEMKQMVRHSYERYKELSDTLHTQHPADMLRAMYPLLMNTPVENQEELVALVRQVRAVVGEEEVVLHDLVGPDPRMHSVMEHPVRETGGPDDQSVELV